MPRVCTTQPDFERATACVFARARRSAYVPPIPAYESRNPASNYGFSAFLLGLHRMAAPTFRHATLLFSGVGTLLLQLTWTVPRQESLGGVASRHESQNVGSIGLQSYVASIPI